MTAQITLHNLNNNDIQTSYAYDISNPNCFTYLDNENNNCEICIYDDGLCLFRQCDDHYLELNLTNENYAKITTEEGFMKFDVKVVDFNLNSDILVMRYQINDEERLIEIKYY